jgi:hypothetical protein
LRKRNFQIYIFCTVKKEDFEEYFLNLEYAKLSFPILNNYLTKKRRPCSRATVMLWLRFLLLRLRYLLLLLVVWCNTNAYVTRKLIIWTTQRIIKAIRNYIQLSLFLVVINWLLLYIKAMFGTLYFFFYAIIFWNQSYVW